jgi:hypothetical protein
LICFDLFWFVFVCFVWFFLLFWCVLFDLHWIVLFDLFWFDLSFVLIWSVFCFELM